MFLNKEEEVIQEQSSNKLHEEQVLQNENLPDKLEQKETTPENKINNNKMAPVIKIHYNNLSWEDIPPQVGIKRVPFNG